MLREANGRVWVGAVSILLLAGLGGLLSGCGDGNLDDPKVIITSVEGDGNAPGEIETAIVVRGENFVDGDKVEVRDAATGMMKSGGVGATTFVSDTELTLDVTPSEFETGDTKTIVTRDAAVKAIKAVTYLSGPTYVAGAGLEVAVGDVIQTKLSATGGLENTQGTGADELGVAPGGIDATHLNDMGAVDGQVLKWNTTNTAWEVADDQTGGAGSGTVDTIVPGPGIAVDDADVANPIVSASVSATGGLTNDLGATSDELGLAPGTSGNDGQVLKWNDTSSVWEFAADDTGAGSTDTLQDVVERGGAAVLDLPGASIIQTQNTSSTDASAGVFGVASGTTGLVYGVAGQSNSEDGRGVYGAAVSATGVTSGVYGLSSSAGGRGVYGLATASSGANAGVQGVSLGDAGIGVTGRAMNTTPGAVTHGVYGISDSDSGYGVYATSNNVGLYATGTNKAAEFTGAVDVTGDVTVVGALTLTNDPPGAPMEAATRKYVDDSVGAAGGGDITGVAATAPLTGGGAVGDVTIGIDPASTTVDGYLSSADWNTFSGKADAAHNHTLQQVLDSGRTAWTSAGGAETLSAENTSATNDSRGIYGYASAATGSTVGVWGQSDSSSARGVWGYAGSASGVTYGVRGQSDSNSGYGVYARGNNVGLYATGTNKAAVFAGQVDVTGDVTVTGALTLSNDPPGAPMEAATKKYVDDRDAAHDHTLAGDVTGTVGATVVGGIHMRPIRNTVPNANDVLKWDGSQWIAQPDVGLAAESQTLHEVVNLGNTATVDLAGGAIDVLNTNAAGYGVVAEAPIGLRATGVTLAAEFIGPVDVTGDGTITGALEATTLTGNGSGLSNLTETDTLADVSGRGGQVLIAAAGGDVVDVRNTSNTDGSVAIRGYATGGTAINYGLYGQTGSSAGYGVFSQGRLHATGNISTAGSLVSTVGVGTAPLQVTSTTTVTSLSADTVDGSHASDLVSVTGDTMTGMLMVDTTDQYSVNVDNDNAAAAAVWGVYARADGVNAGGTRYGVQGVASGGGTNYGVYGTAPAASGYGVYANGRFHATGAISTGSTALVTNLNADTVDGAHAGDFVKITGDVMTGGLTATDFTYSTAKTQFVSIAGAAFSGDSGDTYSTIVNYVRPGSLVSETNLFANVALPHGSTVTRFTVYAYDTDADYLTAYLYGVAVATGTSLQVSALSTTGTGGSQTLSSGVLSHVVTNDARAYFVRLRFFPPTATSNLRIYSVVITYEVTTPLP